MVTTLLATPTVNTNVNWLGLVISLGSFIASMAAILAYIDRRADKRSMQVQKDQADLRLEFRQSIEQLSSVLSERLETKENVNNLKVEVAKMGEQLRLYADFLTGQHSTPGRRSG